MLVTRGKREELPLGEERKYGLRGGAICPRCRRPFAMHLWGMNLGISRLDRCPYCGKWSLVKSQPIARLREAEKAELEGSNIVEQQKLKEDKNNKDLDDTRYI
jgi:DNA-directed RNA polymerase subunit RPC12/RpoP